MATGAICSVEGCGKASVAKQKCRNHYQIERNAPAAARRAERHAEIAQISEVDAAYMAGMIDADGMITVTRRGSLVMPLVTVHNSYLPLIDWMLATVGAGCAYEQKSEPKRPDQSKERWNKVHRYQLTGRKAQSLLATCRPYLLVKARQADLVIRLPQRGRDFPNSANDNQRAEAAAILASVRALNQRGVKAA
jgi:hypothetical protein